MEKESQQQPVHPQCICTRKTEFGRLEKGHPNINCHYHQMRVKARNEGKETPADRICPICQQFKYPSRTLCTTCTSATNNTPSTPGEPNSTKAKTKISSASNGQQPTQANTTTPAPSATASAFSAAIAHTNPRKVRKYKQVDGKTKALHNSLLDGMAQQEGQVDALREVIADLVEENDNMLASGIATIPVTPVKPEFIVPCNLSKDLLSQLALDFQGVEIKATGTDTMPMPLKRMYEKYCVMQLAQAQKTVLIGREAYPGCVLRHHISSSNDVGVDADCECPPGEDCTTCDLSRWIFVDAVHAWHPEEIATLLTSDPTREVFSVQYDFRGVRGGLFSPPGGLPELRWERTAEGLVCQDDQHPGRYQRDPADWLLAGACNTESKTLCWSVVSTVGDCKVYRFKIADIKLSPFAEKDPMSDTYYGNVTPDQVGTGAARDVELQAIVGPITKMYAAGDMFYCMVDQQTVLVPKQGVGYIALWAAGKARVPKTYTDGYLQARQWLKTTKLSTLEKADCIPYMVAFGLLRTMASEMKAVRSLGEHRFEAAMHEDAVQNPFAPPIPTRMLKYKRWLVDNQRWLVPLLGATSLTLTYGVAVFNKGKVVHTITSFLGLWRKLWPEPVPLSPLASAVATCSGWFVGKPRGRLYGRVVDHCVSGGTMEIVGLLAGYLGLARSGPLRAVSVALKLVKSLTGIKSKASIPCLALLLVVINWLLDRIRGRDASAISGLKTYCAKGRQLKNMRKGAKCRIRLEGVDPDGDASEVECTPNEGPFHVGLGVRGYIPVIARHCVHNDLVAVRNRGICERAPPQVGWWKKEGRYRMFMLFGALGPITPTPRKEWLSRYPMRKRVELDEALENVVTDYQQATHRKAFTKTECAVKRGDVEIDDDLGVIEGYDPRLIQGCLPEYVNATGPFAHALSKACKGEHGNTTYGPGLNAESLDDWLYYAECQFEEELVYIDSDAVRLDASVSEECIETTAELYDFLGCDEEASAMFHADTKTHGATSCGVVYSVPGTVPSGKTTTTVGNTGCVITVVEEALTGLPFKAIVAGDDCAIVAPLRLREQVCSRLLETGKKAGFEFKIKASRFRYDMEFCSGRFWPANTEYGFAFGPKPGKLLPKLFFASTKNSFGSNPLGYCQAICIGMQDNVSHLPLAREFVAQVQQLTADEEPPSSQLEMLARSNLHSIRRAGRVEQSPDIWEAYTHIYGLGQYDCELACKEIKSVTQLPDLVEHYAFDMIVAQDAPPIDDPPPRDFATASMMLGLLEWLGWIPKPKPTLLKRTLTLLRRPFTIAYSKLMSRPKRNGYIVGLVLTFVGALARHFAVAKQMATASWLQTGGTIVQEALHWASPYIEEQARRRQPVIVTATLIVCEAARWFRGGGNLMGYLPAATLHLSAMYLQMQGKHNSAVLAHYLFNVVITLNNAYCIYRSKASLCPGRGASGKFRKQQVSIIPLVKVGPESYQNATATAHYANANMQQRQPRKRNRGKKAPAVPARNTPQYAAAVRALSAMSSNAPKKQRSRRRGPRSQRGSGQRAGRLSQNFHGRETLDASLVGSAGYDCVTFAANPGLFPILGQKVSTYDKYKWNKLRYIYTSKVVSFSTNAAGTVLLGFEYDASDPEPTDLTQALNALPNSKPHKPIDSFHLDVPCNQWALNEYYVRTAAAPGGADIKTIDAGILNFCTDSNVNTNEVGILEVEYDVTCYDQQNAPVGTTASTRTAFLQSTAAEPITTTVPYQFLLATATNNGVGLVNTAGSIVPPAGTYKVDASLMAYSTTPALSSWKIDLLKNGVTVLQNPFLGADATSLPDRCTINLPSPIVQANGTDAFTLVGTIAGTGTLTATAAITFVVV